MNWLAEFDCRKATENNFVECPECKGTGKFYFTCCNVEVDAGDFENDCMLCPKCKEWNTIEDCESDCERCDGNGEIESNI